MSDDWVKIKRAIDAPVETVWKMWTDPALFQSWYGPNGAAIPVAEMDVTPGGRRKISMEMQMGERSMSMWFGGEFKEVNAPHRLVYTDYMCDPEGNPLPAEQMPPGSPASTDVIVELSDQDGKTAMTLTHVGVPKDSGGAGGWAQALDKLADAV